MELRPVFREGRFPNVVVAADSSVLAFLGGVTVRRSEDGGEIWATGFSSARPS